MKHITTARHVQSNLRQVMNSARMLASFAAITLTVALAACSDQSTGSSGGRTAIKGKACLAAGVSADLSNFVLLLYDCSPGSIGPPPCDQPKFSVQWARSGNCASYDFELNPGTYWLEGYLDMERDGRWEYAGYSDRIVLNEGQVKEVDFEIRCYLCGTEGFSGK